MDVNGDGSTMLNRARFHACPTQKQKEPNTRVKTMLDRFSLLRFLRGLLFLRDLLFLRGLLFVRGLLDCVLSLDPPSSPPPGLRLSTLALSPFRPFTRSSARTFVRWPSAFRSFRFVPSLPLRPWHGPDRTGFSDKTARVYDLQSLVFWFFFLVYCHFSSFLGLTCALAMRWQWQ